METNPQSHVPDREIQMCCMWTPRGIENKNHEKQTAEETTWSEKLRRCLGSWSPGIYSQSPGNGLPNASMSISARSL
jgi:hypothetical protein